MLCGEFQDQIRVCEHMRIRRGRRRRMVRRMVGEDNRRNAIPPSQGEHSHSRHTSDIDFNDRSALRPSLSLSPHDITRKNYGSLLYHFHF